MPAIDMVVMSDFFSSFYVRHLAPFIDLRIRLHRLPENAHKWSIYPNTIIFSTERYILDIAFHDTIAN
jgi:hypothetical protein